MDEFLFVKNDGYSLVPLEDTSIWGNQDDLKALVVSDLGWLKDSFKKIDISKVDENEDVLNFICEKHHPYFCNKHFQLDYENIKGFQLIKTSMFQSSGSIYDMIEYFHKETKDSIRILYNYVEDYVIPFKGYGVFFFSKGKRKQKYFLREDEAKTYAEEWIDKRKLARLL